MTQELLEEKIFEFVVKYGRSPKVCKLHPDTHKEFSSSFYPIERWDEKGRKIEPPKDGYKLSCFYYSGGVVDIVEDENVEVLGFYLE